MKVLVTAGSTYIPVDMVRGITNIFSGRTGVEIADHLTESGNEVSLLIQKKSPMYCYAFDLSPVDHLLTFKTYDDLYNIMKKEITEGDYDVIIHSAAVSDFKSEGVYIKDVTDPDRFRLIRLEDCGKFKSKFNELFIHMIPTDKIIDKIRSEWNFKKVLVKFKLEVGLEDEELIKIAKESRKHSDANIIVANCLEWSDKRAIVITEKNVTNIQRDLLPHYLYGEICNYDV